MDDFVFIIEGLFVFWYIGQQLTRTIENFTNPGNSQIIGEKYFSNQEDDSSQL